MPSTRTICYYAMYVIGEVESGWSWTAVNYNDPITIGIMQWYGTRAAGILFRVKDETPTAYGSLASSLRADMDAHSASDAWWNARYLNREEGDSIITVFQEEGSRTIQEEQAIADFESYIPTLGSWGLSQSDPKALIFAMSMYHQSPVSAGQVIETAGGRADLERLCAACLNHGVLGGYRTRYETIFNRLEEWDGESDPPDFGQNGNVDAAPGGDDGIGEGEGKLGDIVQSGDLLVLYGKDEYRNGVVFYPAAGQRWIHGCSADGIGEGEGRLGRIVQSGDLLVLYGKGERGNGVVFYPAAGQRWIHGRNADGGGSATGSEAQNGVVELYRSWENMFAYAQAPGRLDPVSSGYGDCSSTVWAAYHEVTGIDVGTWTGEMAGKGTVIASGYSGDQLPIEDMEPADLVLIMFGDYNASFDHVELYMGNNELWGHGGPGNGPNLTTSDARNYGAYTYYWEIRRHL